MIWAVILFGELVLCLAEPKNFVYVSEIEDDDYPPPIDFRYYDRQRYIPPHLQRFSLRSQQNINPNPGSGKRGSQEVIPPRATPADPSTSGGAERDPPSAISNRQDATRLSPDRPTRYESSSLPRTNPSLGATSQSGGPSSHISFNPPGANPRPNRSGGAPLANRGSSLNAPPQNSLGSNGPQGQFGNPGPLSNGGNTGVLPPSSLLGGRSSFPPGRTGPYRPPTFTYSSPQAPQNFQTSLRSFDLSSDRDPRDGRQRNVGNNSPGHLSEEEDTSNKLKPTDIINKLPSCPFTRENKEARTNNHAAPSSIPSFRQSVLRDAVRGVIVTSIRRSPIHYITNSSYNRGNNAPEQHYRQFPAGAGRINPGVPSYEHRREGNPPYGSGHNSNIPKPAVGNLGSSSYGNLPPKDGGHRSQDSNVALGNARNVQGNHPVRNLADNSDNPSTKPKDSGYESSGQASVNPGDKDYGSNRHGSSNAHSGTRSSPFNNKVLANTAQVSSHIGSVSHRTSQAGGSQNSGKQIRTDQEYVIYRPPSQETVRVPQPHEKYPAVGIREYSGPANIAIAPLPPDVDGDEIPGQAWVDYPLYHSIPETSFSCTNYPLNGYYADMEGSCQVYHFCQPGGVQTTFLCPNGTIFSQKKFACQWWYKTDCTETPHYFSLNSNLYKIPVKVDKS